MTITVNGTLREYEQEMSVTDLLRRLNLTTDGIAVAINASVVTRKNHAHTIVHDGDTIEIIRAVAGG